MAETPTPPADGAPPASGGGVATAPRPPEERGPDAAGGQGGQARAPDRSLRDPAAGRRPGARHRRRRHRLLQPRPAEVVVGVLQPPGRHAARVLGLRLPVLPRAHRGRPRRPHEDRLGHRVGQRRRDPRSVPTALGDAGGHDPADPRRPLGRARLPGGAVQHRGRGPDHRRGDARGPRRLLDGGVARAARHPRRRPRRVRRRRRLGRRPGLPEGEDRGARGHRHDHDELHLVPAAGLRPVHEPVPARRPRRPDQQAGRGRVPPDLRRRSPGPLGVHPRDRRRHRRGVPDQPDDDGLRVPGRRLQPGRVARRRDQPVDTST